MMAHLFRRTLVMPDHLAHSMDHLGDKGRHTIGDFFDFHDLSTWIPVISMQQYLDARQVLGTEAHMLGRCRTGNGTLPGLARQVQ